MISKPARRVLSEVDVTIDLSSLRKLLFWAKYGIEKAVGGSQIEETVDVVDYYDFKYKLQVGRPEIAKFRFQKE